MARLLVSVRSPEEAQTALTGGSSILDVKEPKRGSLGRASFATWSEVRRVVPPNVPLSVALGELHEWSEAAPSAPPDAFDGLTYRKLGLARAGPNWRLDWRALRDSAPKQGHWIAVAYADWRLADAPSADEVLDAAIDAPDIAGVLLDTWSKTGPAWRPTDWRSWAERVRTAGLTLAVAGGLTREMIPSLEILAPDIVAVRGAACEDGDRRRGVDPGRVAELAAITRALPARSLKDPRHRTERLEPGEATRQS